MTRFPMPEGSQVRCGGCSNPADYYHVVNGRVVKHTCTGCENDPKG